jgi:hypothetical protein
MGDNNTNYDSILSGVIILLLIVVVWKWYSGKSKCGESTLTLSCGCKNGKCRCRGRSKISRMKPDVCPGGNQCLCNCEYGNCRCPYTCKCQRNYRSQYNNQESDREGLSNMKNNSNDSIIEHITGSGPLSDSQSFVSNDYQETTKKMSLENNVSNSHQKWCDSLNFNGLSTGASSCTTLEETGRSYGTADFVGLTSRKWCKARQMATPADDARVTPSQDIQEWCNVALDAMI